MNEQKIAAKAHMTEAESCRIQNALKVSWGRIAPFWPLKNLIAVNPLSGFEHLPFEDGFKLGKAYFMQQDLSQEMQKVNIETIKWLQIFFDDGQATIKMPLRHLGLLKSVHTLLKFDYKIISANADKFNSKWKEELPTDINLVIESCLIYLGIPDNMYEEYLTLMLTTLPGWASYIQYKTSQLDCSSKEITYTVYKEEYTALRLLIVCLIYPHGSQLLDWHHDALQNATVEDDTINNIKIFETQYKNNLLERLSQQSQPSTNQISQPDAQLIFCIDVRSEPIRKAIENQGKYETYGFAGFFGVPVNIHDNVTNENYASCPVLLAPAHSIMVNETNKTAKKNFERVTLLKKTYRSLKYNITTPFALVESGGIIAGIIMILRTFFPRLSVKLWLKIKGYREDTISSVSFEAIPIDKQCEYASSALRMMGLVDNFAPLIILCGHGSEVQNNAYATSLDCGACGGRHGGTNALILASILNKDDVRSYLAEQKIFIPTSTVFIAAEHNTTTDCIRIFNENLSPEKKINFTKLKADLLVAKEVNSALRTLKLGGADKTVLSTHNRAKDWAQTRPEWGLARNASFIVAPRAMTKSIDLDGRAFLHSYDWKIDKDGSLLNTILTAPMIVAQWINCQYLFSTLDNVSFGSGSKITKNITGKIGIMQGNASDLMHGLPLQSVYKSDQEAYHEPVRLLTIIYAPRALIDIVISKQDLLKTLFANEWVHLTCIDPTDNNFYKLTNELKWTT